MNKMIGVLVIVGLLVAALVVWSNRGRFEPADQQLPAPETKVLAGKPFLSIAGVVAPEPVSVTQGVAVPIEIRLPLASSYDAGTPVDSSQPAKGTVRYQSMQSQGAKADAKDQQSTGSFSQSPLSREPLTVGTPFSGMGGSTVVPWVIFGNDKSSPSSGRYATILAEDGLPAVPTFDGTQWTVTGLWTPEGPMLLPPGFAGQSQSAADSADDTPAPIEARIEVSIVNPDPPKNPTDRYRTLVGQPVQIQTGQPDE